MTGFNRIGVAMACAVACASAAWATPVEVDWKAGETMPVAVARPFGGFLPDGTFLVAGGSNFEGGSKAYVADINIREQDGTWKKIGNLPRALSDGVCCETPNGIFCAGGTDGNAKFVDAFLLSKGDDGSVAFAQLPSLPEPVAMGVAAADGTKVYVVAAKKVYCLDVAAEGQAWAEVGEVPGPAREQHVATVQNGDQKEKMLVVYGGFDIVTKLPLRDGYGLVLSKIGANGTTRTDGTDDPWKKLAALPDNTTTIGAAFLPSGHQHVLLVGGFGDKGWVDRVLHGSEVIDPVKLGWQRKILAYNCVTDAWCEYGEIAKVDSPRCGAAVGIRPGKTPEQYTIILAGGEVAPRTRTSEVSVASFRKTGKFGATAWAVVGVYAMLMVAMAEIGRASCRERVSVVV